MKYLKLASLWPTTPKAPFDNFSYFVILQIQILIQNIINEKVHYATILQACKQETEFFMQEIVVY